MIEKTHAYWNATRYSQMKGDRSWPSSWGDNTDEALAGDIGGVAEDDIIFGFGGNDTLIGHGGDDFLVGGEDNDILRGGAGADALSGMNGFDLIDYQASAAGVSINLSLGTAYGGDAAGDTFSSIEQVGGSQFNDVLSGDIATNALMGGAGHDVLRGGGGDDHLYGSTGDDVLRGKAGGDFHIQLQGAPTSPRPTWCSDLQKYLKRNAGQLKSDGNVAGVKLEDSTRRPAKGGGVRRRRDQWSAEQERG